jgi:hypothetical protein
MSSVTALYRNSTFTFVALVAGLFLWKEPKQEEERVFVTGVANCMSFLFLCLYLTVKTIYQRCVLLEPKVGEEVELVMTGIWLTVLHVLFQRFLVQKPISGSEAALILAALVFSISEWTEPTPTFFVHQIMTLLIGMNTIRNVILLGSWMVRTSKEEEEEGTLSQNLPFIWNHVERFIMLSPAFIHVWMSNGQPDWYLAVYVVLFPHLFPQVKEVVRPVPPLHPMPLFPMLTGVTGDAKKPNMDLLTFDDDEEEEEDEVRTSPPVVPPPPHEAILLPIHNKAKRTRN